MTKDRTVKDVGLEDIPLCVNIKRSTITKVSSCHEIFPNAEFIGWILSQVDVATMIVSNIEK